MKTLKEAIDESEGKVKKGKEVAMKIDPRVIEILNRLLANELAAVNQYMVHAKMCDNWGYERLYEINEKRAIEEMKHAEDLIGRILFLEGIPIVTNLDPIHIGADINAQHENDHEAEMRAIELYRDAITELFELKDHGTREIIEEFLEQEESHIDEIEEHMDQIRQMGIQNYLTQQVKVQRSIEGEPLRLGPYR